MKLINSFIIKYWPVFGLLVLNIILFFANYKPGTYLIGWDNLLPELAPGMNIQRSIFAVWQEYQSLGLLGGMGHASDLIRQIYVLLLTFIVPLNLVRYVSIFTTLFLGGTGAYFLIKHLLENRHSSQPKADGPLAQNLNSQIISLIAAIFYSLNIGTIQTFYAPFEAFSVHFAALPWLFLVSILFLNKASLKNLAFLIIVLLLSTPAAYIPTLFVIYILAISIYILINFILSSGRTAYLLRAAKLYFVIFIVNAFWLLPFLYYTVTASSVNVSAKINQMATATIFAQNKEFGTILDTALLRGFWFNNIDPHLNGNNAFMLAPWRVHFSNPLVIIAGLAFFALILIGFLYCLFFEPKSKNQNPRTKIAFGILFLFSFCMLATNTIPFSWIDELFRKLPLFSQAFRFPFTKFSILAALMYSIMLSFGLTFISGYLPKILNTKYKIQNLVRYSLFVILCSAIFFMAFPAFQGHLFYNKERVAIPQEYFKTFNYFKNQDQNGRIANLPQPTFWGWTQYRWPAPKSLGGVGGNGGSGFLWYGIKQPILDRAFDVWSKTSENYYFELSSALYAKDEKALQNVLNKYQISFILLDENVIYPASPKSLFYDETENLLSQMPNIKKDAQFGKIKIYKVGLTNKPSSFVFTTASNSPVSKPAFSISASADNVRLTAKISLNKSANFNIPAFLEHETIVAFDILKTSDANQNTAIMGTVKTPQIALDRTKIWGEEINIPLFTIPKNAVYPIRVNINGTSSFVIKEASDKNGKIGTGFLTTSQDNSIVLSADSVSQTANISAAALNSMFQDTAKTYSVNKGSHTLTIDIGKIDDSYLSFKAKGADAKLENCNPFRNGPVEKFFANNSADLTNKNSSTCLSFFSQSIFTSEAYAVFVKSENLAGRPFHFWVLNEDEKVSPIDTYLQNQPAMESFILPAMEEDGRGYSFNFENSAIGEAPTHNILFSLEAYPIPQKFIDNLYFGTKSSAPAANETLIINKVSHPNESLYVVDLRSNPPSGGQNPTSTLALSQSYDVGWKAYSVKNVDFINEAFPFIFGHEIKNHIEVNGWANGWIIDSNNEHPTSSIIIVFLPQYLEYAGFAILAVTFILLISLNLSHLKQEEIQFVKM